MALLSSSPAVAEAMPIEESYPMTDQDFDRIAAVVRTTTGIALGPHKRSLVYGRLAKRLRQLGLDDFSSYCDRLDLPEEEDERRRMVNAITTNLTSFFREPHHFEHLERDVIAHLRANPPTGHRLRLWSAGCSTGEEAYSMAMAVVAGLGDLRGWDARILATDIDTDVLAHARAGVYARERCQAIAPRFASRFVHPADRGRVRMADALSQLITFNPLNLFDHWPMTGKFQVIFCRNVVIYFKKEDQKKLFERFADYLEPDGLLYIGHSESLFRVCDRFQPVGRTIYRKVRPS
ncbi:MAG: protein-glutamate O-methyltransferase [Alphaproteobacteria bacterium]|nr:protein-glutamate O-methyltransferase [Alphaproteobacteria bacterium]